MRGRSCVVGVLKSEEPRIAAYCKLGMKDYRGDNDMSYLLVLVTSHSAQYRSLDILSPLRLSVSFAIEPLAVNLESCEHLLSVSEES